MQRDPGGVLNRVGTNLIACHTGFASVSSFGIFVFMGLTLKL